MYKLLQDQRIFMNTKVEFSAWTDLDRSKTHEIFDTGFQQFHLVIDKFSRFKVDSKLSKLNHSNGKEVKVSKELFQLVKFALGIARKTDGAFDPTIIDFLETYGYNAKYDFKRLSNKTVIKKEVKEVLKHRPSFEDIKLNSKKFTIKLAKRQKIDLGSIGKGYAIDLAYKRLLPLKNFVINAGGDIRARGGSRDNKPWLVGLKIPGMAQVGKIRLENQAICCSGNWARKVKFFHHLINPKTGVPQGDLRATFVIAKCAMEADAWATALFALGNEATPYIQKNKIKALLITKHNKIRKYNFPIPHPSFRSCAPER